VPKRGMGDAAHRHFRGVIRKGHGGRATRRAVGSLLHGDALFMVTLGHGTGVMQAGGGWCMARELSCFKCMLLLSA